MRSLHATLALCFAVSTSVFAQETEPAPAPAPGADPALKLTLPNVPPTAPPNEEIGLIPEAPEPTTKPRGSAIPQPLPSRKASDAPSRTSVAEDEMAARIRLRQLKTRVLKEPKVMELEERAATAPTDYEKREALKAYYTLLYARIEKLDRSLKKRATALKNQSINRLKQTKIDPTDPIDPSERADRVRQE